MPSELSSLSSAMSSAHFNKKEKLSSHTLRISISVLIEGKIEIRTRKDLNHWHSNKSSDSLIRTIISVIIFYELI